MATALEPHEISSARSLEAECGGPGGGGSRGLRHPFARIAALRAADGTKGSHFALADPPPPDPPHSVTPSRAWVFAVLAQ